MAYETPRYSEFDKFETKIETRGDYICIAFWVLFPPFFGFILALSYMGLTFKDVLRLWFDL